MTTDIHTKLRQEHQSIYDRIASLYDYCHGNNPKLNCDDCNQQGHLKESCYEYVRNELSEIFMIITDHIMNQESLMKEVGFHSTKRDLFLAHVEEHANLVEAFGNLVAEATQATASDIIKTLVMKLLSIFENHANTHDHHFFEYVAA